ncbi:uncharacterized protein LOC134232390 [Saccostrea cucullata]|uniref:uncharacterized protein LOC134232390 n=1 Tax=Saccostrea cuccullata TaxID=36930 RepID=UPI002ED1E6D8
MTEYIKKMLLRFPKEDCSGIYISCGDSDVDCNFVRHQVLPVLERAGYSCFFRQRDGDVELRIETARSTIPKRGLLLAFASHHSMNEDSQYCQYEIALAMDFSRQILIVTLDDVQIPSLFRNLDRLPGRLDQPFDDWTKKLLKCVEKKIHEHRKPSFEINMIKEFLWNIEGRTLFEMMESHSKTVNGYIRENALLKKRINEIIHLRLQECETLEDANQRLEEKVQEMQDKLSNQNGCPYSYVSEIATQCVKHQKENEQLVAEVKTLRKALQQSNDKKNSSKDGAIDAKMIDCLYTVFARDDDRVRPNRTSSPGAGFRRVPSEVVAFCRRYQGLIGYDEIPSLGRELGLTCSQLDDVQRYVTSGPSEMFWQMCRHYSTEMSESCSVNHMVEALTKIGINVESRPMNELHKRLLEENLDHVYRNMKDVVILLPLFLEKETISSAQALYIEAPKSCKQRVERLIEVLITKENGYDSFIEALEMSGQTSLANFVSELRDQSLQTTSVKSPGEHEDERTSPCFADVRSRDRNEETDVKVPAEFF